MKLPVQLLGTAKGVVIGDGSAVVARAAVNTIARGSQRASKQVLQSLAVVCRDAEDSYARRMEQMLYPDRKRGGPVTKAFTCDKRVN